MGGRFCSLDQTYLACESTLVEVPSFEIKFRRQKSRSKKGLLRKLKCFSSKLGEDQKKKRSSPQFGTIFGRNLKDLFLLAGSFRLIISNVVGGTLNLDGGTLTLDGRPPYNLSTELIVLDYLYRVIFDAYHSTMIETRELTSVKK